MTESDADRSNERRGFVKFLAGAIGAIVGAVPIGIGGTFFLSPLLSDKRKAETSPTGEDELKDEEGFIKMPVAASSLPDDGTPLSFKVRDDKVDAWNMFRQVEIGSVWLRKDENGNVVAFNTICPHLGCAVDYRQSDRDFYCPCHTSTFALDGERVNKIPPRGMDKLEVKLKRETGDTIWLKYQDFRAATEEKIPI